MNYPFHERHDIAEEVPTQLDESYYRQRRIDEAHQVIESLKDTRREPPVEVQQAHRIGTLEAELRNATERWHEQYDRAEKLEAKNQDIEAFKEALSRDNKQLRSRVYEAERLYENLKARKKTTAKK